MSETIKLNVCPKCGGVIPSEAPQGLCPKCVLGGAANPTEAGIAATATGEIPTIDRIAAAFPQLEIVELIGRGGMGFVFKARQPHLDRYVALKLLPDKLAKDPHFAERFNREGRVLAKLNHPNIVSVFDFGQAGGFYFLLMEYVDGVNLRQAMRAGRFSPAEALAVVPKICEALQYAHEQGVLHRDIKPENILLDAKGRVKIADFGIAKLVGEDANVFTLTGTGAALGTPHYMAPEQLEKPSEVDHRADIYSLGVVFYEMLTGELPIGRFKPPSARTPLDQRVDEIVMRALERERELRQRNVGEIKTQVERVTSEPPPAGAVKTPATPLADAQEKSDSRLSAKAIWGFTLVVCSFILPLFGLAVVSAFRPGNQPLVPGFGLILAVLPFSFIPGLMGTILGWIALSDIRAQHGKLRGATFAAVAALSWPGVLLVAITMFVPYFVIGANRSLLPRILALLIPAGALTFLVWSIYTTVRWVNHAPPTHRRGVLKWVFLALMLFGIGSVLWPNLRVRQVHYVNAPPAAETNAVPNIRFTITAVELREAAGVRWLAIDYMENVQGDCDTSFPWNTTIPGFKAEVRSSAGVIGDKDAPVRYQRIEYRMPASANREQLESFRDEVARTLNYKTFRLEPGDEKVLFEFAAPEGGSLTARVKAMSQLANAGKEPLISAQLWVPEVVPGETPRPYDILQEAGQLAREGRYEQALQRHIWYHHHALEFQPSQAGVRLSFALQQWMELARRYPKAKDALLEIRDSAVQDFSRSGGSFAAFTEITSINKALAEDHASLELFRSIEATNGKLARQCYQLVEDSLVETGQYAVCAGFIPDLQKRFNEIRTKREKFLEEARNPKVGPAALRQVAEKTFVKETRTLVEILVGVGRKADAEGIRDQAVAIVDDPQLRSAVTDAEARVAKMNAGALEPAGANDDAVERRIRLAREQLQAIRQRVLAGVASQQELAEAQRDLEVAEARGDAVKETQAKLKYANHELQLAREKSKAGLVSAQEMRTIEGRQAIAEIESQQALRNKTQ